MLPRFNVQHLACLSLLISGLGLSGCTTKSDHLSAMAHSNWEKNAESLRQRAQSPTLMGRAATTQIFYVADFNTIPSSIIATLQDMGYHVSDSNIALGYISAKRKVYSDDMVTVTFNSEDENFTSVRASFNIPALDIHPVSQSQMFFQKLSKSIFLKSSGL